MAPECVMHMDSVQSRTTMMSSGFTPHGEHAVAFARTRNFWMPSTRAKKVFTSAVSSTTTAFTGLQPGTDERQRVVTLAVTAAGSSGGSLPPFAPEYWRAIDVA
jgi:hypothetical protein